jgi:hypothetical protein
MRDVQYSTYGILRRDSATAPISKLVCPLNTSQKNGLSRGCRVSDHITKGIEKEVVQPAALRLANQFQALTRRCLSQFPESHGARKGDRNDVSARRKGPWMHVFRQRV